MYMQISIFSDYFLIGLKLHVCFLQKFIKFLEKLVYCSCWVNEKFFLLVDISFLLSAMSDFAKFELLDLM